MPPAVFLFSIKPVYATAIVTGVKKFELRRGGGGQLMPGDVAVIYASGKVKRIYGHFIVGRIFRGSPREVWRMVTSRRDSGIGSDAWRYISGSKTAVAIEVKNPMIYTIQPSLYEIRSVLPDWNPPMSFVKLDVNSPVFRLFIEPIWKKEGFYF